MVKNTCPKSRIPINNKCLQSNSYIKKNKWFVFNDTTISEVQDIISDKNYCLFYRKIK